MLYVQRDENGKITGLTVTPGENTEEASLTDQDVNEFLTASDPDMIRVLEDLIQVLISKNVITVEDLPETACDTNPSASSKRFRGHLTFMLVSSPIVFMSLLYPEIG